MIKRLSPGKRLGTVTVHGDPAAPIAAISLPNIADFAGIPAAR